MVNDLKKERIGKLYWEAEPLGSLRLDSAPLLLRDGAWVGAWWEVFLVVLP